MICSPTEPAQLRDAAAAVSMYPESFGADLLVAMHPGAGGGWAGVQRKEISDLCVSIDDGRLWEQVAKMRQLECRMLLVEGDLEWSNSGEMMYGGRGKNRPWKPITRERFDGVMWEVQHAGVWLTFTRDLAETIRVLEHFERWRKKPRRATNTREPVSGAWGTPDSRDFQVHLLTGIPGVGPELAGRILDSVGMPWTWRVSRDQLLSVQGLGAKKVDTMLAVLA